MKRKSVTQVVSLSKEHGAKYETKTEYFCGKAKNMTISTTQVKQVTCDKCLYVMKDVK